MSIGTKITTPSLTLLLMMVAYPAAGDGVCYAGTRDTTAAERATMMRILNAAREALPPAPAGWMIVNDDPPSVPQSLCMDFERKPWPYDYSRTFRQANADKQAAIEAGTRAAADIMKADMARKQPRLDAIRAKSEVLVKQQVAFIEKGDMPKALALNEQMAVLQEQAKVIMEEGDAQQRSAAIMKETMRDIEIGISVRVNPAGESPLEEDSVAISVAGNPAAAHRWDSQDEGSFQGGALVLFGQWRTLNNGARRHAVRGHVPANFVHAITVSVHADEQRLASVIETIDFGALAALVAP